MIPPLGQFTCDGFGAACGICYGLRYYRHVGLTSVNLTSHNSHCSQVSEAHILLGCSSELACVHTYHFFALFSASAAFLRAVFLEAFSACVGEHR